MLSGVHRAISVQKSCVPSHTYAEARSAQGCSKGRAQVMVGTMLYRSSMHRTSADFNSIQHKPMDYNMALSPVRLL